MFDDIPQKPTPSVPELPPEEAPLQQAPRPVVKKPFSAPAPKKIGKEDATKRKSNAKFLIWLGLIFAALFVLFIILMVLVIGGSGGDSPVMKALGMDSSGIKSFLLAVINLSFGFLALLFFVFIIVGIFRLMFAKKGDKEARWKGIRMLLVGIIPMVVVMVVWLFLYNFISNITIASEQGKEEITVISPEDLTNLKAPVEITFSAENVIRAIQRAKLEVTNVRWDFNGDGTYETEAKDFTTSYLYNLQGNYKVGLEVSVKTEDKPRTYTYALAIKEALFGAEPATGTAPLEVQFDATNLIPEGVKIQSLDWDFNGDNTYEITGKDNIRPRYTFDQIGTFKVHLRMIDEGNVVQNFYRDIEITSSERPLLTARIDSTPGLSGAIPLKILFDGSKSESLKGQIVKYEWTFGDGSQVEGGKTVSHIYNNPGTYTVTLKVTEDSGNDTSSSVQVEAKKISSPPEAKITTKPLLDASNVLKGTVPFKVSFDASASSDPDADIVDYEWDFGTDGAKQVGQKAEYTYEKAGAYTVNLIVRDSEKQESKVTATITVEEPGVKAVITAKPEEGTAPLTVTFDGSSSSTFNGKIVSYEWNFGDKSPGTITSAQISHKYNDVGTYTVKLKVVTNQNESAETTKLVYVREIPLKACFNPSRRSGLPPLSVTFDALCSTGPVSKYSWNFGDGGTSDTRKPSHTFEAPGAYNVVLEVSDAKSNVSTFSDVIVVEGQIQDTK